MMAPVQDIDRFSQRTLFLLLLVWGLTIYVNTLPLQHYYFDDRITLLNNPAIRDITRLDRIWEAFNSRFVVGISFAANFAASKFALWSYRLVNVLIHVGCAFLAGQLMLLTWRTPYGAGRLPAGQIKILAAGTALIFLTHPIQTEAVNLLTQRYVLLAAFFYLMSLIFYIRARLGLGRPMWGVALSAMILAMFCKEIAFTLPLAIMLYEFSFFGPPPLEFKKRLLRITPFLAGLLIIPATLLNTSLDTMPTARVANLTASAGLIGETGKQHIDITRAGLTGITRWEYFLTEINVLRTYLRLLFFPIKQNVDYDYPVTQKLLQADVLLSAILLSALAAAAVLLWSRQRVISFSVCWFFLTLSIESSLIPIGHVIAEYRLYLALAGFALALPLILLRITQNNRKLIILFLALGSILSFLTIQRNSVWQNPITFWEDAIRKSPAKARAYTNLGIAYLENSNIDQAITVSRKAIELKPDNFIAYTTLGFSFPDDPETAINYFLTALHFNPQYAPACYGLAEKYKSSGRYQEAIAQYRRTTELDPAFMEAYYWLGITYLDVNDPAQAQAQIQPLKDLRFSPIAELLQKAIDKKIAP